MTAVATYLDRILEHHRARAAVDVRPLEELALHALRKENLANNIHVSRDGEEAPALARGVDARRASRA